MPIHQRRRWHHASEFGPGPRVPLDREQRAQFRARLDLHRRAGRLTALQVEVGQALVRRLGQDGRLNPSHDTIARDAGCSPRTVRRALAALAGCRLVRWIRRLVRVGGWRAEQTSSAYELMTPATSPVCDGQVGRGSFQKLIQSKSPVSRPAKKVAHEREDAAAFESRDRQLRALLGVG